MADTSKATKYDLIQRERVCDDIWLCTTRPTEKCYKPCKVHNPAACDGAGLPGVDWEDDDVFEDEEEEVVEDEALDTSISDSEVWDSDVETIEDVITPDGVVVNQEMERWMEFADLFYGQDTQPPAQPSYGIPPAQPQQPPSYYPWNIIYPPGYQMPVPGGAIPSTMPLHHMPTPQDIANANNMINNDPWPLISRAPAATTTTTTTNQQVDSSRGWDELIDEQERMQEEMAAAVAAQCVGAMIECETTSDSHHSTTSRFSHPQTVHSTDFWRRSTRQQALDS